MQILTWYETLLPPLASLLARRVGEWCMARRLLAAIPHLVTQVKRRVGTALPVGTALRPCFSTQDRNVSRHRMLEGASQAPLISHAVTFNSIDQMHNESISLTCL